MVCMKIYLIAIIIILTGCAALSLRTPPSISGDCPPEFNVKGNDSPAGWIYHTAESPFYYRVKAEECFKTEAAAKQSGYRKFKVYGRYHR